MKYCIGCKHLKFDRGSPGYDTDCTAGIGAEEASIACGRDHWTQYLYGDDLFDVEQAMQAAETCADYQERAPAKDTFGTDPNDYAT
jgi:hypothetical protein